MGQVSGKVALITGGAAGIGAACAKALAAEGASVVITDLTDDTGQATAAAINASGGKCTYMHQDVTDESTWQGIVDAVIAKYGKLDTAARTRLISTASS
jgi:3(or 17)beta-hydroxysteroid dehydrogenase